MIKRGGVGGRELADELEYLLHGLAPPDDALLVVFRLEQGFVGHHLFHVLRGFQRVGDQFLELRDVERLEQVVVGAQFHRLDGGLGGAVGGHEDDQQLGVDLPNPPERLQPVDAAHAHIHDHQIGLQPRDDAGGLPRRSRRW